MAARALEPQVHPRFLSHLQCSHNATNFRLKEMPQDLLSISALPEIDKKTEPDNVIAVFNMQC